MNLALDGWFKEVAPSRRLRKWFAPRRWKEFDGVIYGAAREARNLIVLSKKGE